MVCRGRRSFRDNIIARRSPYKVIRYRDFGTSLQSRFRMFLTLDTVVRQIQQITLGRKDSVLGETKISLWEPGRSRYSSELEQPWSFQLAVPSASSASSSRSGSSTISTASDRYSYFMVIVIRRPGLHSKIQLVDHR